MICRKLAYLISHPPRLDAPPPIGSHEDSIAPRVPRRLYSYCEKCVIHGCPLHRRAGVTMPKSRPPGRPRGTAARKTATRKVATRRTAARKTPARKTPARRTAARKTAARRITGARKTAPRRTTARKTATRKARRTTARKTAVRKTAGRTTAARKAATRKTAARRTPVARKRRRLEISTPVLSAVKPESKVTPEEVPQPEQARPAEEDYQTRFKPEPSA